MQREVNLGRSVTATQGNPYETASGANTVCETSDRIALPDAMVTRDTVGKFSLASEEVEPVNTLIKSSVLQDMGEDCFLVDASVSPRRSFASNFSGYETCPSPRTSLTDHESFSTISTLVESSSSVDKAFESIEMADSDFFGLMTKTRSSLSTMPAQVSLEIAIREKAITYSNSKKYTFPI